MEAPHVEGELSTREVQLASLEVLKKIDGICSREGIRYWVMYGTLIGAIRHHGFIPWDDDLDIAMPRPDYERFLAWFRDHADEMRPLVALDGYRQGLPFLITRISDTTYKMVGEFSSAAPELGAFVDVYPIDGCGNDSQVAHRWQERCRNELRRFMHASFKGDAHEEMNGAERALRSGLAFALGDSSHYRKHLQELALRYEYDSSEYVSCLQWENDLLWLRSWEDSLLQVPFEDMVVPIPNGYDKLLRLKYGDYMSLPPENERVGHHFYAIVRRISK